MTRNATLKAWVPELTTIDELLELPEDAKTRKYDTVFSVRAAYQSPIQVKLSAAVEPEEALPNTFEDALVFQNISIFGQLQGGGEIKKFRDAIAGSATVDQLGAKMFDILQTANKARFALDVLFTQEPDQLVVPTYISDGLSWLDSNLSLQQLEASSVAVAPAGTSS